MKIQLSESVLSEAEVEVGTEVEEDKRASCCYVLLGRPEGENHCVSYSEVALRHAFSFSESREASLALSRMNFSIGPVYKKDGTPRNTLSQCQSVPRAWPSYYLRGKTRRISLSLLYYGHCFNELSPQSSVLSNMMKLIKYLLKKMSSFS